MTTSRRPDLTPEPDLSKFECWAEQAAAGNAAARQALSDALWVRLEQYVAAQPSVQATGCVEDSAREVMVRVMARLAEGRLVEQYLEWKRVRGLDERFLHWLFTVARNEALDYVRQLFGRRRAEKPAAAERAESGASAEPLPSRKRFLNLFAESLTDQHHPSTRPPFTNLQTAKQVIEAATRDGLLSEVQLQVLALWLNECSAAEIEELLQLEPETAEALRRAAVMKLRRHFARTARTAAS